ncbi:MAG: pseudaminic acid synthase, partial [Lachnospiraceae bacterium]|nr:pseudaminic acid synthase [Lachnospiraceae bacterium]
KYGPTSQERGSLIFRRSIFTVKAVKKGERFTEENIRVIRPGFGLKPKEMQKVIGKRAKMDLDYGTPLSWEAVDEA